MTFLENVKNGLFQIILRFSAQYIQKIDNTNASDVFSKYCFKYLYQSCNWT